MSVAWSPNPGSQQLTLAAPFAEVLLEGTRGGGKTECILADFAQHVGKGYGSFWRGILFRQTYKQLEDVLVKSRRMFSQIFPGAVFKAGDQFKWVWPTGEELLLRQIKTANDYWDYHGHEYPWMGWEELTNWRDLDLYDTMKACNRSSHPDLPRRIVSTCNPLGIGHTAVKERFVDPAPWGTPITTDRVPRVRIHSSFVENPYIYVNDPQYIERLQDITDPNVRKAWLEGSWDIIAGGALDDLFDPSVHIIDPFTELPKSWTVTRSFDWGASAPFSVGWHTTSDGSPIKTQDGSNRVFPTGTKIRIAEWYGASRDNRQKGLNMTNVDVAKGIVEREEDNPLLRGRVRAGAADAQIFYGEHGTGYTIADEFFNEGVQFIPAIKGSGSRRMRLALLRDRLKCSVDDDGKPGYYSSQNCPEFARQIPLLSRDPFDYECVDTECEDHLYDELTYEIITATSGGSLTSFTF